MLSGIFDFFGCCATRVEPRTESGKAETKNKRREKLKNTTWLAIYQAKLLLDLFIIPGTHHSAIMRPKKRVSQSVWGWAQTQNTSITDQLHFGVRLLDFRIRFHRDQVVLSHGLSSDITLDEAVHEISAFLQTYATEFVIVFLRADKWHKLLPEHEQAARVALLNSGLAFAPAMDNFNGVRVGDVAGKALFFSPDVIIPHVTWRCELLAFCDIWQEKDMELAKTRISSYVKSLRKHGRPNDGSLVGIALDGTFPIKQQVYTAKELNEWLVKKLVSDAWSGVKTLGLCIVDFADASLVDTLLSLNAKPRQVRIAVDETGMGA